METEQELREVRSGGGGSSSAPRTINVEGININQSNQEITFDGGIQLSVTFTPENPSNKGVAWSSSNPAVATVNEKGLVTNNESSGDVYTSNRTSDLDSYIGLIAHNRDGKGSLDGNSAVGNIIDINGIVKYEVSVGVSEGGQLLELVHNGWTIFHTEIIMDILRDIPKGTGFSIRVTPKPGYEVNQWIVNGTERSGWEDMNEIWINDLTEDTHILVELINPNFNNYRVDFRIEGEQQKLRLKIQADIQYFLEILLEKMKN